MPARARLLAAAAVLALAASIAHVVQPTHSIEAAPVEVADHGADRGSDIEV